MKIKSFLLIVSFTAFIESIEAETSTSKYSKNNQFHNTSKQSTKTVADNSLIFNDNLEDFLSSMSSDQSEKAEFRGYYSKFLRKQNRRHRIRKRRRLQSLRAKALNDIEVRKPNLYTKLEPYLIDLDESPACRTQRLFLTRYALFEEFKEKQAMKQLSVWGKTKRYAKNAVSRVGRFGKRVADRFIEG